MDTDRLLWWAKLFSLLCLFLGSYASDEEKSAETNTASAFASVPSFTAVYAVNRYYPGNSVIACLVENSNDTLLTHLVPSNLPNPTFKDRGWGQEVKWYMGMRTKSARGAVCSVAGASLYSVSFPLMSYKARLVPEYLSYTISAEEDLRARLLGAKPRGEVWWQQEPLQKNAWKQTNFTDDGALVIPAAMLSGSGFYSFINESNVNDTSILGTLSLHIRDCPAYRYGDDCSSWCPDCLHGGVCHSRTGQCVCQEGTMGPRCEMRCEKQQSGRYCSLPVVNLPGRQVCQPSPAPCRCIPGYTGVRCSKPCAADRWGADCAQACNHRCVGNCDSQTAECDAQGVSPCAGGAVGLPRLRQAPKVMNIGAEQVTVEFSKWKKGYDDGETTQWETFTYAIKLRETDNSNSTDGLFKHITASPPSHTLMNLTPATKYEVMVVVVVSKSEPNLTCAAEGKGRERVHTVFFSTICPEDIVAPVILRTEKTSETSVVVGWKPVPRPRGCHVQYHLSVTPEIIGRALKPLEIRNIILKETQTEVKELKANVEYTITVLAKSTTSSATSTSSSRLLKIHKNSVGYGSTVVMVVAVLAVTVVVIMVVIWRKKRDKPASPVYFIPIPTEDAMTSPSPPSP